MDRPSAGAAAPDPASSVDVPAAPAVVVVVVAHAPGDWFEQALASLTAQDYPNLSILVIDPASSQPVKDRVASVAPTAFVRRIESNLGFGAAANEVLDVVEGAAFYLFCHDDVALDPPVVRLLVEEAFRSNAGVVGPKLTRWSEPRRILQLGEGVDKAGYSVPLVDRDELDQEQHDNVRDAFTVPAGCMLVRADLFYEVGGFDEGIDLLEDDLSLCWRVHLAGARVVVAPEARVRHVEALATRVPAGDMRRRRARHRLRVVLTSYSGLSLLRVLPQIAVLHVAEALYALAVGRTAEVRDVADAWWWNLRRFGELRDARREVRSMRRVKDREIRRLQARGSSRFNQFVQGQVFGEEGLRRRAGFDLAGQLAGREARWVLVVWGAVALGLLAGSRHLLTQDVPSVGELAPFSDGPVAMLRDWASGWRSAGLGSQSPQPSAFGLLGLGGLVTFGQMGFLRVLLTLGMLPLGALAAYRLALPTGSRAAQLVTLGVYVCNPLPYNALAEGHWSALVVYAAAPALIGRLARAGAVAPFGSLGGDTGPAVRRPSLRRDLLATALLTALVAALLPAAVAITAVLALAIVAGSFLAFSTRGDGRVLVAGLGGALVAGVLHLPWSLDFIGPGSTLSGFLGVERGDDTFTLEQLLRFETGPLGAAPLGYAFLVAAALPLLIGRGWRHGWAVRAWTIALTFWAIAWAGQEGWLGFGTPAADVLLAPAAAGLALAAGLGAAAFQQDLPGYRFGWRQLASGLAGVALLVAALPVLGAVVDGRWSMPAGDPARALRALDELVDETPTRTLWLGDADLLPLGGWELDDRVAYATTDGGTPQVQDVWAGSDDGATGLIADAVRLAQEGETARLGRLLAPMGVRHIVVVERLAPAPWSSEQVRVPARLSATLGAQLDLRRLDVPAGLTVYENQAFVPRRAAVAEGVGGPDVSLAETAGLDLSAAMPVLPDEDGPASWSGELEAGRLLLAEASASGWQLEIDGERAPRDKAFGWANGFQVEAGGAATLSYATPLLRYLVLLVQAVAWLALARYLLKSRYGPGQLIPAHGGSHAGGHPAGSDGSGSHPGAHLGDGRP